MVNFSMVTKIKDKQLMTYLGQIGKELPELSEEEWKHIFSFVEYFFSIEVEDYSIEIPSFDWKKVLNILNLLGKVK